MTDMKKIFSIILGVALVISATSCGKDFLEKAPVLSLSNSISLSTLNGCDQAVHGAYYYISSAGWWGCNRVIDMEMRCGNGVKSDYPNSNRYVQPYNWNYSEESTVASVWEGCYYTASAVNNVIDALEGLNADEQDKNNLKAECLFLRAFAHFENVLMYGQPYTYKKDSPGVPYVFKTDPAGRPARETVAQVYEYVVADLLEAEKIIDPAYARSSSVDPRGVADIYTIWGMLSRVYLYMGEWQKSADYATKVIDSNKFKMWKAGEYPYVWTADKGSGEVIFEVYGKRSNSSNANWDDISWVTKPDGYGDPQVSTDLLSLYAEGDARLDTYCESEDPKAAGVTWTTKYAGKGDNAAPDCNNVIIMRLSEMYLNRAEAAVNGASTGSTAVKDLNVITSNRGAAAYTSVGQNDIQIERRKELAWEGHYLYDLARWGKPVIREGGNFALINMNQNVAFPDYRWALPIPKRELELNENLVQNEGYKSNN